jgi:hypothetical protein
MRLALLAGGVAVAVLVAVVALGRGGSEEEAAPWAQQASEICERGLADARAVVASGDAIADSELRAVHLYGGATQVEAGVLADLEALPRPEESAATITRTLQVFAGSHDEDVVAVAKLERRFDRALLERRVNETVPIAADLRARFLRLGADGCARYLNPESY